MDYDVDHYLTPAELQSLEAELDDMGDSDGSEESNDPDFEELRNRFMDTSEGKEGNFALQDLAGYDMFETGREAQEEGLKQISQNLDETKVERKRSG